MPGGANLYHYYFCINVCRRGVKCSLVPSCACYYMSASTTMVMVAAAAQQLRSSASKKAGRKASAFRLRFRAGDGIEAHTCGLHSNAAGGSLSVETTTRLTTGSASCPADARPRSGSPPPKVCGARRPKGRKERPQPSGLGTGRDAERVVMHRVMSAETPRRRWL
mgnify:CR=1 FL=1